MAMLFIGPMVGQWRAQIAEQAIELSLSSSSEHHQHADHGFALGHDYSEPVAQHGHTQAATLVGALLIEHCGYCHLATHFCAVPMALQYALGGPSYAPHPALPLQGMVQGPMLYGPLARGPPLQLA